VEIKQGKATLNKSSTYISDNAQELVLQCIRETLASFKRKQAQDCAHTRQQPDKH
jgi:hypothetical protein